MKMQPAPAMAAVARRVADDAANHG